MVIKLIIKYKKMNTIIFCITISVLITITFNLINLKKINLLLIFTYIIDVLIVSSLFYSSIKIINKLVEQPFNLMLSLLAFIILLLIYFSFFRKMIYVYFSNNKQNFISVEKYILDKYDLNIKVEKGVFNNDIIFIPIVNRVLINEELADNLNIEDLSNSIILETKISFGNFIYILNYLIPAIIFYYAFTSASQNNKTILIVTAAAFLVILKKVTSIVVFKSGLKTLKGKINKDELIKSYTNYINLIQKKSSKIEKMKQNLLLKNKISMIEKAL